MPSSHKSRRSQNERIARSKALNTHVYISGISGHHALEVGLAYYYRGHYIYAYPAGNLIEPIPYSTRKGIMIQGVVSESAPVYIAGAAGLVKEGSIRALEAGIEREKRNKEVEADASNEENPSCIASLADVRDVSLASLTPHAGAHVIAASAPASRLASRAASPSGLRLVSSHAGLVHLDSIRENIPFGTASGVGYLDGLGDHALSAEDLPRPKSFEGFKRDRNATMVVPCALHGEECDGVSVEESWLTERARTGKGFVQKFPMVARTGRLMVDWARLLEEEKAVS